MTTMETTINIIIGLGCIALGVALASDPITDAAATVIVALAAAAGWL